MPSRIFSGRSDRPDWNDIGRIERNRFPGSSYLVQFPDFRTCESAVEHNRRYLSPFVFMLNGRWDFKLFDSIQQMPDNIFAYRSGFDSIEVPGSFDVSKAVKRRLPQPTGERADCRPERRDEGWPFPLNPPLVPDNIPVGVYHRSIQLPPAWSGVRKRIVFHAAQSAYHVVVNGRIAGFAQSGQISQTFDITSLIHDGVNELFVLVYAFSSGSYFNAASHFFKPGLLSDVYLEAMAPVFISDLDIWTVPGDSKFSDSWQVSMMASILSFKVSTEKMGLRISIQKDGQLVTEQQVPVNFQPPEAGRFDSSVQRIGVVEYNIQLDSVLAWSDESPELYDVFLTCLDSMGREISCVQQSFGFRHLSVEQNRLWLNGQPVQLRIVDFQPQIEGPHGTWSLAGLVRDLRLIKQQQLNTVRLSAGPLDPIFYELCDTLGLYVIQDLAVQPLEAWQQAVREQRSGIKPILDEAHWIQLCDRVTSQIQRDRNRTCLIAWTALDLCDSNVNRLNQLVPQLDADRPLAVCCKSANRGEALAEGEIELLDPGFDLSFGGTAGLSNLLHAQNGTSRSSGVICGHWDEIRSLVHVRNGLPFAASLAAIREAGQPISFQPIQVERGQILITNQQYFSTLDNYRLHWQIHHRGKKGNAGEIDLPAIKPGETFPLTIDYGPLIWDSGERTTLQLTAHLIAGTFCLPQDHTVAVATFPFQNAQLGRDPYLNAVQPVLSTAKGRVRMETDRHLLVVSGLRFWLVFNRITGMIESWRCADHELFAFAQTTIAPRRGQFGSPLVFWRPLCSQDQVLRDGWYQIGLDCLVQTIDRVEHECDGQQATLSVYSRFGAANQVPMIRSEVHYAISEEGQIQVDVLVDLGACQDLILPRIGFRLPLRRQYDQVFWRGQGPDPTWPGNRTQTSQGLFVRHLDELMGPALPGLLEIAPHDQTEWIACADATGFGLLCESDRPFVFHARDYLLEDLLDLTTDGRQLHQNLIELVLDIWFKPVGELQTAFSPADPHLFRGKLILSPQLGFKSEL